MKHLLLPLLAAIALPTAVNSEGFNEKEIDAMIKEICYKDYGYVEATKKSLIAAQQGKRETALALNEYAKNSWMKCMREQVDKFYK